MFIDRLKAQLAALKRFGASSEKLDRAIELLELMLEDSEATLAGDADRHVPCAVGETPDRPARQVWRHLPRESFAMSPRRSARTGCTDRIRPS